MRLSDVTLWQDRDTPALAVSADGGICYRDNAAPNYGGRPMYVCKYKGSFASFEDFQNACAWFDWIRPQLEGVA